MINLIIIAVVSFLALSHVFAMMDRGTNSDAAFKEQNFNDSRGLEDFDRRYQEYLYRKESGTLESSMEQRKQNEMHNQYNEVHRNNTDDDEQNLNDTASHDEQYNQKRDNGTDETLEEMEHDIHHVEGGHGPDNF